MSVKQAPKKKALPTSIRSSTFAGSIKTAETLSTYNNALVRFLTWAEAKDMTAIPNLRDKLIDYVTHLKEEGRSFSSQNIIISAVRKWAEAYDKEINFDKVYNYTSEQTTNHEDKPYSLNQLRTLIEAANPRLKAIILTLVSTGVRVGAIPEMRLKDLTKIDEPGIYKIVVYPTSTRHKYYVFTTPEAARAIDAYLAMRKTSGEDIKPETPLFRKEYGKHNVNEAKAIPKEQVSSLVTDLLVKTGLRTLGNMHEKHETRVNHGFRKYFNTALVRAGAKPVVIEILLGHKIGLQNNYLRLTEEEVLAEYLKAASLLTVSEEPQLRQTVKRLEIQQQDVHGLKAQVADLWKHNQDLEKEVSNLRQESYEQDQVAGEALPLAKETLENLKALPELMKLLKIQQTQIDQLKKASQAR